VTQSDAAAVLLERTFIFTDKRLAGKSCLRVIVSDAARTAMERLRYLEGQSEAVEFLLGFLRWFEILLGRVK